MSDEQVSKKVRYNVEKLYFDDYRVYEDGREEGLNIYQNNMGRLEGGRFHDPIYNNPNAKRQIYTFGCSWTYGWDLEQEQTFTHLLGDEDTAVYNCGAGGTGFDFARKRLAEVYIPESRRQLFIITIPHTFRRIWFDDDGVVYKSWSVPEDFKYNEYNIYFSLLHHYEMINKFVGRDKIIWGTWDMDLPKDKFDVFFERIDYTDDGLHPGPKSHKQYANRIKEIYESKR